MIIEEIKYGKIQKITKRENHNFLVTIVDMFKDEKTTFSTTQKVEELSEALMQPLVTCNIHHDTKCELNILFQKFSKLFFR